MKNICITGANGFVGKFLCKVLVSSNKSVRGIVRTSDTSMNSSKIEYVSLGDMNSEINWREHLNGFDCIIHCAGKAHDMNEKNNVNMYHSINTEVTKVLAEQAVKSGVKRFIFLSTIKVNGESTGNNNQNFIFKNKDIPNPQDAYSTSKLEAEKLLWEISAKTNLEIVVVRLPLVYGYGSKGNLAKLIKLINSGMFLPFSLINNKRSLIGIDNLVDLLIRCIDHPEASGKTFLASDRKDLSTPEFIKLIASSMERKASSFPFPISVLKFLGSVFGRREEINRLVGSLRIDNSYTKEILNWKPPLSIEEGIRRMVQGK